ncbi:MAG: TonB-dependent receptor [Sphingomonadales bacterium]|nr:TonB-dependent receptor [Sphingomonadales bacterium]
MAGLFFYDETIDQHLTVSYGPAATQLLVSRALPGFILNGVTKVDTNRYRTTSLAAYGQATIHLTEALSLTGGAVFAGQQARHYSAVASGGLPLAGPLAAFAPLRAAFASSGTFDVQSKVGKVSGSTNLSYRVNSNALVYANYSRGNRSGPQPHPAPAGSARSWRPSRSIPMNWDSRPPCWITALPSMWPVICRITGTTRQRWPDPARLAVVYLECP